MKTTQVYAQIVDEKKQKAASAIKLNINQKTVKNKRKEDSLQKISNFAAENNF